MVFAHGYGCDQNMWRFVAAAFEPDYKVIRFDHVGHGGSDASAFSPAKYASLDGYAGILGRILALSNEICRGRIVLALEGGYNLDVVAEGARIAGQLLSGELPGPDPVGPAASTAGEPPRAAELLERLRETHNLPTGAGGR